MCEHCNGVGGVQVVDGAMEICPECLGTGERIRVVVVDHWPEGEPHRILIEG